MPCTFPIDNITVFAIVYFPSTLMIVVGYYLLYLNSQLGGLLQPIQLERERNMSLHIYKVGYKMR